MSIGRDGQLSTSIYDKRDCFKFSYYMYIYKLHFLSSHIPYPPAYGVFHFTAYAKRLGFASHHLNVYSEDQMTLQ